MEGPPRQGALKPRREEGRTRCEGPPRGTPTTPRATPWTRSRSRRVQLRRPRPRPLTRSTPGPTRWRSAPEVRGPDCSRAAKAAAQPVGMDAGLRGAGGDPGRLRAGTAGHFDPGRGHLVRPVPADHRDRARHFRVRPGRVGRRILLFISGAASLILALLAFRHFGQGYAILLLAIWIGIGFIFRGVATTISAVSDPHLPGRGWNIFLGVLSLLAGIVVLASPFESIVTLAIVVG